MRLAAPIVAVLALASPAAATEWLNCSDASGAASMDLLQGTLDVAGIVGMTISTGDQVWASHVEYGPGDPVVVGQTSSAAGGGSGIRAFLRASATAPQTLGRTTGVTIDRGNRANNNALTSAAKCGFFNSAAPLKTNCTRSSGVAISRSAQVIASLVRRSAARRRTATAISSWRSAAARKTGMATPASSDFFASRDHSMRSVGSFK